MSRENENNISIIEECRLYFERLKSNQTHALLFVTSTHLIH